MPISKNWSQAKKSHVTTNVPTKSGVYELKSFDKLVYIGESSDLQGRLLTHLSEKDPNYYRFETTGFLQSSSKLEREHFRKYKQKNGGSIPPWNTQDPTK